MGGQYHGKLIIINRVSKSPGVKIDDINDYIKPFITSGLIFIPPEFVGNKPKGRISKRVFQENKAAQIFRKTNISYPLIRTCSGAYQGVRNVRFLENLTCFVFLKHPFWDWPFCLITDELVRNVLIQHLREDSNHFILYIGSNDVIVLNLQNW